MRKLKFFLVLAILTAGLLPLQVYAQATPTHIVGQIAYQGYDFPDHGGKSLNGYVTGGLFLTIRCVETGEYFVSVTKENGIFTENDMVPGPYEFRELIYSLLTPDGYVNVTWKPLYPMEFYVEAGKVNNLGFFMWETSYNEDYGDALQYSCNYNDYHSDVRNTFQINNPASSWNNMDWVNSEITERGETLLIGMLCYFGYGFESWGPWSLDGIVYKGLELTIIEEATGTPWAFQTDSIGFFMKIDLPAGRYYLNNIYYKITVNGEDSWASWDAYNMVFEIYNNRVNNLGVILWNVEYDDDVGDAIRNDITFNYSYVTISDYIKSENPESKWSLKEWVDTVIIME